MAPRGGAGDLLMAWSAQATQVGAVQTERIAQALERDDVVNLLGCGHAAGESADAAQRLFAHDLRPNALPVRAIASRLSGGGMRPSRHQTHPTNDNAQVCWASGAGLDDDRRLPPNMMLVKRIMHTTG